MSSVSSEDFVVAWCTSKTTREVAETLKMRRDSVVARARYMRQKGVKLPRLERANYRRLDDLRIAQLNSLIKKHTGARS